MSGSKNETSHEEPLDQVREILFGQLQRSQDSQVRGLEEKVEELRRALDRERDAREAREAALAAGTVALRGELEARDQEHRSSLGDLDARLESAKVDRESLASWFDELARRLREGDS